jgi:hypothetical protein
MPGIVYTKSSCKCTSCIYLLCAIKYNEDARGNYDLKIYCQLSRCPEKRKGGVP